MFIFAASFPSLSTSSSQDHPLYSGHSSLPLSGAIAFASEVENNKGTMVETTLKESQDGLTNGPPPWDTQRQQSPQRSLISCHKEKLDMKTVGTKLELLASSRGGELARMAVVSPAF